MTFSGLKLTAEEMAAYKRNHWRIENNLHHELDEVMKEDRSTAHGSKNNLAIIRKFVYNILRLVIKKEGLSCEIQGAMDYFEGYSAKLLKKYIFSKVESLE